MKQRSFRQQAITGLKHGDAFTCTRSFSQHDTEQFGDITRDYNPVHYDRRWTDAKGFEGQICHGLLVGSMICEIGGQIGWLASGMDFKFIKPVYFNETITCTLTIENITETGRAEAEATFVNSAGQLVCLANLKGRVPVGNERDILAKIVAEGDPSNKLSPSSSVFIEQSDI